MTQQRARLSSASYWAWGVAVMAGAAAVWHIWAITETAERPYFWMLSVADVIIAATAAWHAWSWPVHADFGPDGLRLGRTTIPYESITEVRRGDASAKGFWVAFWLPTSLVIGVIAALRDPDSYDRDVVELATANGIARFRWRDPARGQEFLTGLGKEEAPKAIPASYHTARDYTPQLSVGGGLLVAVLGYWLIIGGLFSTDLFDLSTSYGPYPLAATSANIATLTGKLTGIAPLPNVPAEFVEEKCDRVNNSTLGPSPHVIDLHLRIIGQDVPDQTATAIENQLRNDIGMQSDEYLFDVNDGGTDVAVDIPEAQGLYIEIFTGCVDASGLPQLRTDLQRMGSALGVKAG